MIANSMTKIEATEVAAPPAWALMERNLIALMEESGRLFARQYFERGGGTLLAEDVDDLYEQLYNFGLFYAIGAADDLLDLHFRNWNAVTRISDERFQHRTRYNDHKKVFRPSIHNEFWNLDQAMEWHHLSEGNMAFYDFGVADPTVSENMRRARSFAAMFIGEDPQAPNWDPEYRILRSPFHSSQGPKLHADAEYANTMLLAGRGLGGQANYYGVRASLYPIVKNLETRWFENPARRKQIVDLFDRLVLQCDTPNSLAATALVTNAYLYTGDNKYKQWVLDYTEAWMERTEKNGGICPDNVDAQGVIGGGREGVWWGGQYGWNHYQGYNIMFHGINIAVECAQLLTGDSGYLDFLRSQIKLQVDNGRKREDGQFLVPVRYGPDGWDWNPAPGLHVSDGIEMRKLLAGTHSAAGPGHHAPVPRLYGPRGLRTHNLGARWGRGARLERCGDSLGREELGQYRIRPLPVLRRQKSELAGADPAGGVPAGPRDLREHASRRAQSTGNHRHQPTSVAAGVDQGVDPSRARSAAVGL